MSSSVAKLAAPKGPDSGDRPKDSLANLEADLFGSDDDTASSPPSAGDLGSQLFDGAAETSAVQAAPAALNLEPTTGSGPAKKSGGTRYAASSGAWPKWLPAPTEAADILVGKKQDPNVTPWVKPQLAQLTSAETQALWGRPSAVDLSSLRAGVIARFRLAVALGEKPELGSKFDDKALEALLADTDAALDGLKAPEGAPKDVQEGFASARGALARDAVALSNYVHESQQAAAKAALRPADPNRPVARKITFEEEQIEGRGRRRIVLWVMLGLTAIGTGVFHGLRLRPPPPSSAAIANLPKNIVGAQTDSRVSFVRTVAKGAADKTAVQAIEAQASQQAQHMLDVGNGRFILVPAELAQGGQTPEGQKP